MTSFLGCNPTATFLATDDKPTALGTISGAGGKDYVFVQASAAIAQYDCCGVTATFTAAPISTTNGVLTGRAGVAQVAIPSGSSGWLLVMGTGQCNVVASTAANTRLNTTGTAGTLDGAGTASSKAIIGIQLSAARGAGNGPAPCVVANEPTVSTVVL